jgi:tetratricopeptide (TPR) repeat protein
MEAILLSLVCLAPWGFGANEPEFEFVLSAGVAVLLGLWGVRILLEWQCPWAKCPVALCLAALLLLGVWQLVPLPPRLLGWLSPGTARLYGQLLPHQAEILPYGETGDGVLNPAVLPISLNPGQTRQELSRLLAVLLLFGVVRYNIASPASLRRLSVAALVNGSLLSWFALFQSFSSPDRHTIYWKIPYSGTVFGPFGCCNHFAFYVNLCIGLGFGLLLSSGHGGRGRYPENRDLGFPTPWNLLGSPKALWVSAALAFMFTGVACSLSRGGLVSLLATLSVFLAFGFLRSRRLSVWTAGLVSLVLALGMLAWLGLARVHDRLATVWEGKAFRESRLPIWSRLWPLAVEFPVWGTGYGTIPYVEPLHRYDLATGDEICGHAENEYLEALVEGGTVRLALGLLAIGLVYRCGVRAVARPGIRGQVGLVFGALFAFTTLVIHSLVDFGLHIPAIALLATVLCAHLCALADARGPAPSAGAPKAAGRGMSPAGGAGSPPDPARTDEGRSRPYRRRVGLAPAAGAALAVCLGAVLGGEGWQACRVHWLRHNPSRLNPTPAPVSEEQRLESLQEAARLAQESASLQVEIALIYFDRYWDGWKVERIARFVNLLQAVEAFGLVPAPGSPAGICHTLSLSGTVVNPRQRPPGPGEEEQRVRRHLVPALKHFLRARALCPVLPEPHRYLARSVEQLGRADTRLAYLERLRFLTPRDGGVWYACGDEALGKEPERTWGYWRHTLEMSDKYLPLILARAREVLSPGEVIDKVIPERPRLLLAAALQLYPDPEAAARRPYLERALSLLDRQPTPPDAEDLYLRARLQALLGDPEAARQTYETLLTRSPQDADRRYEFAKFLRGQKQLTEARRELSTVLRQRPEHGAARQLLEEVNRELAGRD